MDDINQIKFDSCNNVIINIGPHRKKNDTDCYQQIAVMLASKLFYGSLKCFDWQLFIYFCQSYFFS